MKLLLISNSTNAGEAYLDYPKHQIRDFLGEKPVTALFLPFAGVTVTFDDYEKKVRERFQEIGHDITSVHHAPDPVRAVEEARAVVVGGGNTWQLIKIMQDLNLLEPVRKKVMAGTPFVGWSAGANVACPTIRTTNDMPILQPAGFHALSLVPFQINPHYMDVNPEGHAGETREARILEFIEVNPDLFVVGLREGTMLWVENNRIRLIGPRKARIFRKGSPPLELSPDDDLNFLLK